MFVNGQKVDGAVSIGELRAVFDRALAQTGVPAPAHPAATVPVPSQPPSK